MHFLKAAMGLAVGSMTLAGANDAINDIMGTMEYYGKVATETKQNEQYQPYIVSVFQGTELEQLGIINLEEALSLVPGVDIATDSMDYKSSIFRGSNPFAFGQSKLLIDGVVVNDLFLDTYTAYLSMPIEMIKRIEVIRGPGSKADGINAYAGSIHVITYAESFENTDESDRVVVKGGSYDYRMAGFVKSYRSGDFRLHADFYYQNDNKSLPVGYDSASTGIYNFPHLGIDNTPLSRFGEAPVWLKQYSLGLMATYGNWKLNFRHLYHHQGSAYGINTHLPTPTDHTELPSTIAELAYARAFGNLSLEIKGGVKFGSFSSESMLLPEGYRAPSLSDPLGTATLYPDGFYGIHDARQRTLYHSTFLKYRGWTGHNVNVGYRVLSEETYKVTTVTTDRDAGTGLTDYSFSYPFFDRNARRKTYVFSIQDQYDISDDLTLMYGINVEDTSLNSLQADPRISMVYRAASKDIFKLTYSRAHRNPSWQEMYTLNNYDRVGNPGLDPEKVDAFEAAYIRKFSADSYLQADLFYLRNRDQIDNTNATGRFSNAVDTDIYGLELEFKGRIGERDELYLNYAYVDGEDDFGAPLANVAKHMLKGYYSYQLLPGLFLSGIGKYVSSRERVSYDTRGSLDGYATLDAALHYSDAADGFNIAVSVKNIFDADVRYPSKPLSYTGDYPQEGRTGMVVFSKAF